MAAVTPRTGSRLAMQVLYVHWLGKLGERPVGWGGAGFLMNVALGFGP
jgi:hypothetical protein